MTKKLLIVGDPTGLISLRAITSKGFLPENITVWENDDRHIITKLLLLPCVLLHP
jgi:hypothetical protein